MRVLFICSGNAHRSPLAEALLRKLRPDWNVESAGIHVAIPISEEARAFLATENAEQYLKNAPEDLDSKRLKDYDLIIAMEQKHKEAVLRKCPECEDRIVVWYIEDPFLMQNEDAKRIYEEIKGKVKALARLP